MKTKTKFYALLLALGMFLLSLFGLGGAIRARAEGKTEIGPISYDYEFPDYESVPNPDENLTSLYYFSDYVGSEECFENGYIHDYISMNPNIENSKLIYGAPNEFWMNVNAFWTANAVRIENAFIIFEVCHGLPKEVIITPEEEEREPVGLTFVFLEEFFSWLKDCGCKIMFICGTDESYFADYNGFLQYVDIHVNLDLSTIYHYTAILKMAEAIGEKWSNTVLVIDNRIGNSWAFFKTLVTYLIVTNGIDFNYWDENDMEYNFGLTVYFYQSGTFYNPYAYGEKDDYYAFLDVWQEKEYAFVICGEQSGENDELWELERYRNKPTELYEFNYGREKLDYYVSVIMRDFILNDLSSLDRYNNWKGRCVRTFKPLFFFGEGWLLLPYGADGYGSVFWLSLILDLTKVEGFYRLDNSSALADFLLSDPPEFTWTY